MGNWKHARIGKQYHFSASHQLTGVPEGHQCGNLHGHNYVVVIEARVDVSHVTGFICDFSFIDKTMNPFIKRLDHSHLNDIIPNPTAENLAQWIMDNYKPRYICSVKVWETPNCWAQVINKGGLWNKNCKTE